MTDAEIIKALYSGDTPEHIANYGQCSIEQVNRCRQRLLEMDLTDSVDKRLGEAQAYINCTLQRHRRNGTGSVREREELQNALDCLLLARLGLPANAALSNLPKD